MAVEILRNEQHNGIEIYFNEKPNTNIIQKLKNLKFRWHNIKKCWFAKATAENENFAKTLADLKDFKSVPGKEDNSKEKAVEQADKEEQAKLKEEYFSMLFAESWQDKGMQEHFRKNVVRVVKLENGNFIKIEKPTIETSFCFGYSLSRYDNEDYNRANEMCDYANTNEQYFLNKNLEKFDRKLKNFTEYNVYLRTNYINAPKDSKCKALEFKSDYDVMNFSEKDKQELTAVSNNDKDKIITAYQIERKNFEKRLQTYLKKYGLTKIRTWSYWRDE